MADVGRDNTEVFLKVDRRRRLRRAESTPDVPERAPGPLRIEPQSAGLRDRIWWGAASDATAIWAAEQGMNLMSSTLKTDETGEPFHVQQRKQIEAFREAWTRAGHEREPRVSVSRSIFADRERRGPRLLRRGPARDADQFGVHRRLPRRVRPSYAAEPDELVEQLREDEAIAAADTLLLTMPNQLGVDYNAHVLEAILTHVAPALGWR